VQEPPKTIFKFEPFSLRAVQNLKCNSVYFGSPAAFNDPFDCALSPPIKEPSDIELNAIAGKLVANQAIPANARDDLFRLPQAKLREMLLRCARSLVDDQCTDFNTNKGITCYSECNDNMLMWSHYGGQHRGFCLEFRTDKEPFNNLRQVTYRKTVPEIDITQFMLDGNYEHILELFCTKSIDWAYEREWRAIHAKAGTPFSYPGEALKAIYFGAKMTDQDIDMLCLILHGQIPTVELNKGRKSTSEFKIEFERLDSYIPYAEAKRKGLA
jgi:hypothetical protein